MRLLRRVRATAERRRRAEFAHRKAIEAAAREHSQPEIARAAGVSQQAVGRMLARIRRET